jgi:Domain of unknown function (DUF4437)
MSHFGALKSQRGQWLCCGAMCALIGFAVGTFSQAGKQMVMTPFQRAKFLPVDPSRPDGPQIAVLRGDPATGPSEILLKLKKSEGLPHYHSSDYSAIVIDGIAKHWAKGESKDSAAPLRPASYWFQPAHQAHGDECLSDECLIFINWRGKMDVRLSEEPKK